MNTTRRSWLKHSSLAIAGLSISQKIFAFENYNRFVPGTGIRLNANENPYGPSPFARQAMMQHYTESNRYPDDIVVALRKKIASRCNVAEENILLGAGSSEIIGLVSFDVARKRKKVITAEPAYRVWNGQAMAFGLEMERIPLDAGKKYDLNAISNAINDDTAMVYVCNPNNPTGNFLDYNTVKDFAEATAKKTTVLIDEAYTEFANLDTLATTAAKNPSIIVARTFSKIYGLAGARVGYAVAHPDTIARLGSYQPGPLSNLSKTSAEAASAALDDIDFVKDCLRKIAEAREICYTSFKELSLEYIPSYTNFILFNIDKIKKDFTKEMEARNIHVQYRNHFGGNWCRVSMGTLDEMRTFCSALKEIAS